MEAPVHEVLFELRRRQLQAADEEYERHRSIENAVFGAYSTAMSCDI